MDFRKESEMFNQVADYYDRFRPSYPKEIVDSLISVTGISEGANLLEIGSGSGKATELFVDKGYQILAVDPGQDLVKLGNERFEGKGVSFEVGRFEEFDLKKQYYDVIYAAQSFHWVPQPAGYEKCAYALKDKPSDVPESCACSLAPLRSEGSALVKTFVTSLPDAPVSLPKPLIASELNKEPANFFKSIIVSPVYTKFNKIIMKQSQL